MANEISPLRFPPERGQPRCSQGTSQAAEVSCLAGFRGGQGPHTPGGAQEPACGKQTGHAMRNASPHVADPAYSTPVACTRAGQRRPPGGDPAYRQFHRYPASAARFRPRAPLDGPPGAVISHRPRIGVSGPHTRPRPRRRSPSITWRNLATFNLALPHGAASAAVCLFPLGLGSGDRRVGGRVGAMENAGSGRVASGASAAASAKGTRRKQTGKPAESPLPGA